MSQSGIIHAVDSVDLSMESGESWALVGESGCGKSVLGMAIMRLLPSNATIDGNIRFQQTDLREADEHKMQSIRGKEIGMIPQNSAMALNPVMTIGRQVTESLILHQGVSNHAAEVTAISLLESLGIQNPERAMVRYPHEFSGGMRERILIAMSLICNPILLIADEPTAGLDILIRNQTLELLKEQSQGKTLLLITHDLGCAHALCSQIIVMYAGEIVESGPTSEVLSYPKHPYTLGLLASLPSAGLHPIPGLSPSPTNFPPGCRFCERCQSVVEICYTKHPLLRMIDDSRQVRCLRHD
ncbi:MAG: ABC transporter ATP-binding protein [Methanospirillum sp.]|uniref:ABC transporter ATP-binding protein n=1 Tax=Methanospirillum sp. TaxID=45200 RepID=UPI00236BDC2B|nr:ABC transporter ATP-binding protein [Methanospirillum sp.]MDD1728259.1 ABC transporter ATP-binding protein [Methanospirillum sp.]